MDELAVPIFLGLLLILVYLYMSKPSLTPLKVTTNSVMPTLSLPETPPDLPVTPSQRRPISRRPASPGKPFPLPRPNPLLSPSRDFPPFYRKPKSPDISPEQQERIYHSVQSILSVQLDSEELVTTQELLSQSYWTANLNIDDIDPGITGKHRATFGKILDKLMRQTEQEMKMKAAAAVVQRREEPPPVTAPPPATTPPPANPLVRPPEPAQPPAAQRPAGPSLSVSAELEKSVKEMQETKTLKESLPALPARLNEDMNEIVGQITSDVSDIAHLRGRVQRCIQAIQQHQNAQQSALVNICEKVLRQCQTNVEDIKNGSAFAIAYTTFLTEISLTYPDIQRYVRDLLYIRREVLIPIIKTDPKLVDDRLHIRDTDPERLEMVMNLTRAYGAMRAALNSDPNSQYGMRDGWTWLARILNTPTNQIDRLVIPALTGYLKVLKERGTLKLYGCQGRKLAAVLQSEYKPVIRERFWAVNNLYHTFVSMLEEAIADINRDFA